MNLILKTAGYAMLFMVVSFVSAVAYNHFNDTSTNKEMSE